MEMTRSITYSGIQNIFLLLLQALNDDSDRRNSVSSFWPFTSLIHSLQRRSCGRKSKNEDKWESNSTRVFTGVIETYIEWWKNNILGWRCDGTFLHLRHCSCKQLPGANEKQNDVGDWRSPWRLKCDLAVGWSSTPFWVQKFRFSWCVVSDVERLPFIGWVALKFT